MPRTLTDSNNLYCLNFQDVDDIGGPSSVPSPRPGTEPVPEPVADHDNTTLLQNDEESFALAPVDATVLKGKLNFKQMLLAYKNKYRNLLSYRSIHESWHSWESSYWIDQFSIRIWQNYFLVNKVGLSANSLKKKQQTNLYKIRRTNSRRHENQTKAQTNSRRGQEHIRRGDEEPAEQHVRYSDDARSGPAH